MYAQVVRPQDSILKLEEQYVRLLVVNMQNVDVGWFDFDFDTTFAVLALNSEKQVYLRYGGRDSTSAESFVSVPSLEKALTRGLELHESWKAGELPLPEAGASRPARSYPFVANIGGNRCVHCHDVASGRAFEMFDEPEFDLSQDIWIYPEPASLGLDLDPDEGSQLRNVSGAAELAGLKAGDRIVSMAGYPANTYSDIQYRLHQLPSEAESIAVTLSDGREISLPLPTGWRYSDISWRRLGIRLTPSAGFGGAPLALEKKADLGLDEKGFATKVSFFDFPQPQGSPLKEGDIVYSVNGVETDSVITHAALYISQTSAVGDSVQLGVIRGDERIVLPLPITPAPSEGRRIMDSDSKPGRKMKGGGLRGKGKGRERGRQISMEAE